MITVHRQQHQEPSPQWRFFPTIDNTVTNPYGISDEAIGLVRRKPIGERLASIYMRQPVDGADYNGDCLPISAVLNAASPQVTAMRNEQNYIERKRKEDGLPVFTPYCVLRYDFRFRAYYPVNYTCLLDFDIRKEDNPTIDLNELKKELSELPQIAYCGLATNGIDLFCLVPVSAPKRHTDHARALLGLFRKQGVIIRIDDYPLHTRTLSSDPKGHFNPNAVEFTRLV